MQKVLNLIFLLLLIIGCKTEEPQNPPTVITKVASDVKFNVATLNGEVTDEGFSATSDRGFVFSEKNTNPSLSDSKAQSGYGKGVYSIMIDKLPVNTKYYFKAYATNTKGTSYGDVQSFTTADYKLPTVVTDVPKNITYTTAELGGLVTDEGGGAVSESGFVVGTNVSPTIADLKFSVTKGKTTIALIVSKLNVNTKYFVRSYAINEKGISYGNEQSFITADYKIPTLSTDKPTLITYYSVKFGGSLVNDGGDNKFTELGICYGLNPNPTISNIKLKTIGLDKLGSFILIDVRNLSANTKYYYRTYAINSKGIGYGNEQSFTTDAAPIYLRDNTTKVVEVVSKTGRIWMDRNLGATQAATSSTDAKSYGGLYQWGRGYDGHQIVTSNISPNQSYRDLPGNSSFIDSNNEFQDWRNPSNNNLWQGVNGTNNPCPVGFRLPNNAEWEAEVLSWGLNLNSEGAILSPLKLPMAGQRGNEAGLGWSKGEIGFYWSSNFSTTIYSHSNFLQFTIKRQNSNDVFLPSNITTRRISGFSIRCIKD
jgi:uncharacterized protein (TIGR02145 family)